jgi:hypothetical protein
MARQRRASRSIVSYFMQSQSNIFKKVFGVHVRRKGNQLHTSPAAFPSNEKDLDPKKAKELRFFGKSQ